MLPNLTRVPTFTRIRGTLIFFIWQAFAITVEDVFCMACRRCDVSKNHYLQKFRFVGFFWVLLSFWISIPFVADDLLRAGVLTTSTGKLLSKLGVEFSLQKLVGAVNPS